MWRLVRANQLALAKQQLCARRTLAAAAAATGKKRALDKDQLLFSNKPGKKKSASAAAGSPPPAAPPPTSKAPSSPSLPPPSPPSSGGSSMMPVFLVGAAALAGVAAYMYYNDKDVLEKLPWNQTDSKSNVKEATETTTVKKEPDPPTEATASQTTHETGGRVVQIAIPPDMMNKSTASSVVELPDHPEKGNRVFMDVKKEKKKKAKKQQQSKKDDTRKTKEAGQELQTLSASTEATKDSSMDLDALSTAELKARIVQLASEMKDRTQWEAVRLKEFLVLKEKEISQQHMEIIQKQRLGFEETLARQLREKDAEFHETLKETLAQKDANVQNVIDTALKAQQEEHNQDKEAFATKFQNETQTALNKQFGEQMEAYKQAAEQDLQQKVTTLAELSDKLQRLELALEASQRFQQGSSQAHKLSAAALALSEVLETHSPAAKQVSALEVAAGQDGVIATAVRTLPPSVQTEGVPTLSELQTKFEESYSACRQAALVPSGRPGLDGQLAGMVFAALKYPPQADDPAPEENPNNPEHVLSRARKYIQLGELSSAVEELEKLQGQVAFVVGDWKKAAMDRVAVDKAVKVINLECALLHESIVE